MKNHWHKTNIEPPNQIASIPVPIVADGAIATVALGEGRLIPLLILNTSNRQDIENMISAQVQLPPGNVKSYWARPYELDDTISLILEFSKPSEVFIILYFKIESQGILIEQTLQAKALYLQAGRLGDRASATIDKPRMLVEIQQQGFEKEWIKIWPKEIAKMLRKRGLTKKQSKVAAETAIQQCKVLSEFRMRP